MAAVSFKTWTSNFDVIKIRSASMYTEAKKV